MNASVAVDAPRSPFADPLPDDLRDELIDASLINGKLVHDLEKAREDIASLEQKLKTAGEDYEHLNASTTHTQAELKTFQTERQQSKSDLSTLKQKLSAAEEALVERERELTETRAKAADSTLVVGNEAVGQELEEARRIAKEWETKAAAAQQAREKADHRFEEWKAKAKAGETALEEAQKLVAAREAEAKAAKAAFQHSQKVATDFETKATDLEQALAEETANREQVGADFEQVAAELEQVRASLGEEQARVAAFDDELHKTRWRLGEVEAALVGAQESELRLTTERAEMQRQMDDARMQLTELTDLRGQVAHIEAELHDHREKLRHAVESNESLTMRSEALRLENDSLRRDLVESHAGRELVEARTRRDEAIAEQERIAARLGTIEADLTAVTAKEAALRGEIDQTKQERDDALAKAAHFCETRTAKDNEVLRGIIARLNADLVQRTAEVVRAKRARYGLKTAYVLFGVGCLALTAFAIWVLPHAFKQ